MTQIKKIGVIGAGNMGSGIAQKIAQEGIHVVMVDLEDRFVERGLANIKQTMEEAVESGQEYLICSSMPSQGQTIDNYKKVAEEFNKAGEACKKLNLKFGYHNHEYEFETENNQVLYDVLLKNTEADLVHMELDLGWVIVAGKDPLDYFKKYPGRFPLWHLKDMDMDKKESTEFGKGGLDIPGMMAHKKESGVKHIFIEQEEYASNPLESMKHNMAFLKNLS